jgi:hypothetical protein
LGFKGLICRIIKRSSYEHGYAGGALGVVFFHDTYMHVLNIYFLQIQYLFS